MRWSLPLLVPALACLAHAESGKLYIYDSQLQAESTTTATTTVSPETARLIIASRLGLDQFHELGSVDEESIRAINQLSADQQLFTTSTDASVALVLAEDLDMANVVTKASNNLHTLHIADIPSVASTEHLVVSLAHQASGNKKPKASHLRDHLFVSSAGPSFKIARDQDDLELTLATLIRQDYTVLTLAIPNDTTSKHTYGSYAHLASLDKRSQFKEAPLITESRPVEDLSLAATASASSASSPKSNYSTPLKGILPQCYSSKKECEATTRSCTGHGSCILKYTNRDARPEQACYTCSCSATVFTNKDGSEKTTRWGGPACQKKDVVMPFWLLGGFSVIMVSLVSWGVGVLLTMGNEELPSVIGAGVSGVPRSK